MWTMGFRQATGCVTRDAGIGFPFSVGFFDGLAVGLAVRFPLSAWHVPKIRLSREGLVEIANENKRRRVRAY